MNARAKPKPLYEQVKTHVVDRIADGTWAVGDRIPGEHKLAAVLGASRLTVHRAFGELANEGILTRVQGVGTFVAPRKPVSTIVRLHNIADEIRERGDRFSASIHCLEVIPASHELARHLEMVPGRDVFHSSIVYSANGVPQQLEERYVSPEFAPDFLKQDFLQRSTSDYLQSIAMPTSATLTIEALLADGDICALLQIPRSEPCLVVKRQTRVDGKVTTYTRYFHPGTRYRVSSDF